METIVIKQKLMGYSLEAKFLIMKEKRKQQEEFDTGLSWVGDQLVPTEYTGAGAELAIAHGEMLEDFLVTCILINAQINVKEHVLGWTFVEEDIEEGDVYMMYINQCEEYAISEIAFDKAIDEKQLANEIRATLKISVLDLLCAIIACDKNDEDNATSEYLKIAKKAGLKVGQSVIPHYDKIMEVYETMPRV